MQAQRKSFRQQELESPGGQLNAIWWGNLNAIMEIKWFGPANDQFSDLHEKVAEIKQWADREHATTGIYPEDEVQKFLAKFS
jgi:hypothetical protein